jgi:hypothetical protein
MINAPNRLKTVGNAGSMANEAIVAGQQVGRASSRTTRGTFSSRILRKAALVNCRWRVTPNDITSLNVGDGNIHRLGAILAWVHTGSPDVSLSGDGTFYVFIRGSKSPFAPEITETWPITDEPYDDGYMPHLLAIVTVSASGTVAIQQVQYSDIDEDIAPPDQASTEVSDDDLLQVYKFDEALDQQVPVCDAFGTRAIAWKYPVTIGGVPSLTNAGTGPTGGTTWKSADSIGGSATATTLTLTYQERTNTVGDGRLDVGVASLASVGIDISALKGDKGDKGDQGEKGDKGDTGATGPGASGATGSFRAMHPTTDEIITITVIDGCIKTGPV